MSDDDFFDDPTKKRSHKLVLASTDIAQLNELMVQQTTQQTPAEEAHAAYVERLQQLLASQGTNLQAALRDNPDFPYLRAGADTASFSLLRQQAAAASSTAAAAVDAHAWEPPPPDAQPENDVKDYA